MAADAAAAAGTAPRWMRPLAAGHQDARGCSCCPFADQRQSGPALAGGSAHPAGLLRRTRLALVAATTGGPGKGERPRYEQARDELTELVKRLEAGGLTLEQSLQLWERGEGLAAICEDWLEGARARLATALSQHEQHEQTQHDKA